MAGKETQSGYKARGASNEKGKPGALETKHRQEKSEKAKKEAYEKNIREVGELRKKITQSVDKALVVVAGELQDKNLLPEVREKYQWIRESVLNAKAQSLDASNDTYVVTVSGESRKEGVPIDDL